MLEFGWHRKKKKAVHISSARLAATASAHPPRPIPQPTGRVTRPKMAITTTVLELSARRRATLTSTTTVASTTTPTTSLFKSPLFP